MQYKKYKRKIIQVCHLRSFIVMHIQWFFINMGKGYIQV